MRSRQPFSLALQNTSDAGPHAGGCEGGAATTRLSLSRHPHQRPPPRGSRLAPSSPPRRTAPHPDPGSPIPGERLTPLRAAAAGCSTNSCPRATASPGRVPAPAPAPPGRSAPPLTPAQLPLVPRLLLRRPGALLGAAEGARPGTASSQAASRAESHARPRDPGRAAG